MKTVKLMISGKMRSGKTYTTVGLLDWAEKHGYKASRISLAKPLKQLLKDGYGREDREGLQFLGTEVMRKFAGEYFKTDRVWVNLLIAEMKRMEENGYNFFICDDLRFPNELEALTEHGFTPIRLKTTRELQLSRGSEGKKETVGLDHESETALDKYEGTGAFPVELDATLTIDQIINEVLKQCRLTEVNHD